jgi:DoxX-like family
VFDVYWHAPSLSTDAAGLSQSVALGEDQLGNTSTTARTVTYWVSTALIAALFAVPGVALIARAPHFVAELAHLGYPAYFLSILGPWKVLAAVTVLVPRLARPKEWAYAGMIFDATSAAFSRVAVGDGAFAVIVPLVISALVVASWALRPDGRVLK